MIINDHYSNIILVMLGFAIFLVPMTCNADDSNAEDLFRNAQFDFSDYNPDPNLNDLYIVYHIIPSGSLSLDYHKSVYYFGMILSRNKGNIPGSSGYYLSRSKYHPSAVRLTLFIRNEGSAKEINNWIHGLEKNKLITIVPYVFKKPDQVIFTKQYGGDEYEFRKYLAIYTPICIECMGYNYKEAQKIWYDLMKSGVTDITFIEHSKFFTKLEYEDKCKFIDAMYNRKWVHMIINFVEGYDENYHAWLPLNEEFKKRLCRHISEMKHLIDYRSCSTRP